jgi:hypothetical protein
VSAVACPSSRVSCPGVEILCQKPDPLDEKVVSFAFF